MLCVSLLLCLKGGGCVVHVVAVASPWRGACRAVAAGGMDAAMKEMLVPAEAPCHAAA